MSSLSKISLYILPLILFLASALNTFSQTFISGECTLQTNNPETKLVLEYWHEDGWKTYESIRVEPLHHFQFNRPINTPGQFRIKVSNTPSKYAHFVLNPSSKVDSIHFHLDDKNLNGTALSYNSSDESDAYCSLMKDADQFWKLRDSLKYSNKETIKSEIELSRKAQIIRNLYPQTYTALYICPFLITDAEESILKNPLDTQLVEISKSRFGNTNWNNSLFLKNSILVRQLNYHYYYFNDTETTEQYVDNVMLHGMSNDTVQAFLFRFLLDKMVDYKSEEGLSYLITWYATDCTESNTLTDATKHLLIALERCKPGQKIENLSLPDRNGKRISLEETYRKSELTLIMFWRSNCPHCREFEPELEKIYKIYHPKGLEIYAINADKEEETWKKFIQNTNCSWPSVFLAYDSRKDFSKRFPVPSTPTLIAVDKEGIIVKRLIMRSKLENDLQYFFK